MAEEVPPYERANVAHWSRHPPLCITPTQLRHDDAELGSITVIVPLEIR